MKDDIAMFPMAFVRDNPHLEPEELQWLENLPNLDVDLTNPQARSAADHFFQEFGEASNVSREEDRNESNTESQQPLPSYHPQTQSQSPVQTLQRQVSLMYQSPGQPLQQQATLTPQSSPPSQPPQLMASLATPISVSPFDMGYSS